MRTYSKLFGPHSLRLCAIALAAVIGLAMACDTGNSPKEAIEWEPLVFAGTGDNGEELKIEIHRTNPLARAILEVQNGDYYVIYLDDVVVSSGTVTVSNNQGGNSQGGNSQGNSINLTFTPSAEYGGAENTFTAILAAPTSSAGSSGVDAESAETLTITSDITYVVEGETKTMSKDDVVVVQKDSSGDNSQGNNNNQGEDNNNQGGNSQGGNNQGGNSQGGNSQGGNQGGNSQGGNTSRPPSNVSVTSVSLSPSTLSLIVGGSTGTLTATLNPANATNKNVRWTSSNTNVATVDNGVVTAIATGTATITVTTVDGGKTAACNVTSIEYDDQGRQLVVVEILTGEDNSGSRNMALDIAQVAVNYYEVVFSDGAASPTYYRAAGPRGKRLIVRLPVGFPITGTSANAIVFAGYWDIVTDERTLLATGIATHLNYNQTTGTGAAVSGTTTIQADTTNVRFELAAIETRFDTAANSSFRITEAQTNGSPVTGYASAGAGLNNPLNILLSEEDDPNDPVKEYPYWKLPKVDNSATPAISAATATAAFSYGIASAHRAGVKTDITAGTEFNSGAVFTGYAEDGITAVTAKPTDIGTNQTVPEPNNIDITMKNEPVNKGFCMLIINLPVKALSTAHAGGDWWTLRNSLFDFEIHDNNTDGVSLGGALLLCIGEPPSAVQGRPIQIILGGPIDN